MDWKQFIASIIGSLAWPAVAMLLLILVRKELAGLAERLKELTLPGGAKATFERNLDGARKDAERLPPPPKLEQKDDEDEDDKRIMNLALQFPEAAVVESFKRIESILYDIGARLDIKKVNPIAAIETLHKSELIDAFTKDLFYKLRLARNAAAHGAGDKRISPGEALDYAEQSRKLMNQFAFVLGYLEGKKTVERNKEPPP